jgi:hypothetical protein
LLAGGGGEEGVGMTNLMIPSLADIVDPELTLRHVYPHEIAAHYAARRWQSILEMEFLLDLGHDYQIEVDELLEGWRLTFIATSACARYMRWRVANNESDAWERMKG